MTMINPSIVLAPQGEADDTVPQALAKHLAKKSGMQCYVSCSLPEAAANFLPQIQMAVAKAVLSDGEGSGGGSATAIGNAPHGRGTGSDTGSGEQGVEATTSRLADLELAD